MKNILLLVIGLTLQMLSYSQQVTFSVGENQTAYLGMDNRLSCMIENMPCNSIVLTTSNGTIEKESCSYIYRPVEVSDTKIVINKKVNGNLKKIGDFFVRVRNFPKPVAQVGGVCEGEMTRGALLAQTGLGTFTDYPSTGICLNYSVKEFSLSIIRENKSIFFHKNVGYLFDEKIKEILPSIQKGDIISFFSIVATNREGKEVSATSFEITIK
jgi:hypothetical protein